jgi:hypothetical protein
MQQAQSHTAFQVMHTSCHQSAVCTTFFVAEDPAKDNFTLRQDTSKKVHGLGKRGRFCVTLFLHFTNHFLLRTEHVEARSLNGVILGRIFIHGFVFHRRGWILKQLILCSSAIASW